MKRFVQTCKSEWTKVFTTRAWWVLGLVMVLYIAFTSALLAGTMSMVGDGQVTEDGTSMAPMIYALAPTIGYIFPVLIGALSVTVEYRHGTIASTFLWSGARGRVLGAKVLVQFCIGVLYGIAGTAAAVLASVFFFTRSGFDTMLGSSETWWMFLRIAVVMGIWAVVGVGIGVLVRNQAAAIVIVVVFTQFIEPMARMAGMLNQTIGKIVGFLPGAASDTFTGNSFYSMMTSTSGYSQASWWVGGLVIAGYAVVVVLLGWVTRWRADVG